ncbi:MAG: ABC transporter substrate-binding protein [Clostridia bacterium]|nr:ABC transporter substrate-binding protein [Clostridia bacterium]
MKKVIASALCVVMATAMFAGCSKDSSKSDSKTINLWAFTDEIPGMADKYKELHPDFAYDFNVTVVATDNGGYQSAIDNALQAGGKDAPDIYAAEAAFVLKYTQGDMAQFAAAYEDLGIDVAGKTKEAEIAPYTIDIGTRPSDGKVVGLGYQATGGAMIYRASIAEDVFGTSDPAEISEIVGGGSGSWDKFFDAAAELRAKGYGIVSGDGDIWHSVENSASYGWVKDGKLQIAPEREAFLELSKELMDNDYHNDTQDWQEGWFADMNGTGSKGIFCFFGPAWLINYTMGENGPDTAGDWRVGVAPVGFFWGGTWVLASKYAAEADDAKKAAIADFISWITLDSSETGLQYLWANGLMNDAGTKDCVASGKVMAISDGSCDFLGGQNMFEYFVPANANASGARLTQYDETINNLFRDQVRQYTSGQKTKEQALDDFKSAVAEATGLEIA